MDREKKRERITLLSLPQTKPGIQHPQSLIYVLDKTSISDLFIDEVVPSEGTSHNEITWPVNSTSEQYVSVRYSSAVTPELDIVHSRLSVRVFSLRHEQ